jgi:SNF2 family DNA or RNA helicase
LQSGSWLLQNNSLILKTDDDSRITNLTAKEIFSVEFGNKTTIRDIQVPKPSKELSNISFSKFPLDLIIRIEGNDQIEGKTLLSAKIIGKFKNLECPVAFTSNCPTDHTICKNTWFPFVKGSLDEIQNIFSKLKIDDPGTLTLKQYFLLIQNTSTTIKVEIDKDIEFGKIIAPGTTIPKSEEIPGFVGTLYPYQISGYLWLRRIDLENFGCILADEMGLGKTLQVICLLTKDISEKKGQSLIVAPATLLENWRREFQKFSPDMRTLIHRGPSRTAFRGEISQYDIIITSYETILRDLPLFKLIEWNAIILDEAQAIKNPEAQRTKDVKSLHRRVSIAVSGTPVENRLRDLWSLMDFVLPDFLGSLKEYEAKYLDNPDSAARLEPLISPVILRRTIKSVAMDLPDRLEIPQPLCFPDELITEYEKLRQDILHRYGASSSLVELIKLRMFCAHPFLITNSKGDPAIISPKYQRLLEILEEIFENNEKVLIFTSFSDMIDIMLTDLKRRYPKIFISFIDGRCPVTSRQILVDAFNNTHNSGALILNPRAAGTGLNLTGANHVIHYNPEWNPAVEDQASARAYRRGQHKPVTIHKLFFTDCVEEVIMSRLDRKRVIAGNAIVGTEGTENDYSDIMNALNATPFKGEN